MVSISAVCIGHVSEVCRKGLKHPTILHIPPEEKEKTDQAERKSEVSVDSTLVSSGLIGAGDHDCKPSIVPLQVQEGQQHCYHLCFLGPRKYSSILYRGFDAQA